MSRNSAVQRLHHQVAQAVELHVIHGRQEPRLAHGVRPGAVVLPGQRVVEPVERQVLESCGGLGIDDVHQRAVGQVGQGDLHDLHAQPLRGGERRVVHRRGTFAEGLGQVADLEPRDPGMGVEGEGRVDGSRGPPDRRR